MAFKLDKQDTARKAALVEELGAASGKLEDALSAYNFEVSQAQTRLQGAIDAYNVAVDEARGFAEDVARAAEDAIDNKSEKWQEGEKGQAASEWKDAWENNELDEITVEFPEELTIDDTETDHGSKLDELPDEASE